MVDTHPARVVPAHSGRARHGDRDGRPGRRAARFKEPSPDRQRAEDGFALSRSQLFQNVYNVGRVKLGKPRIFQPFIDAGWIPRNRAATCVNDYKQAERAFEKTVLPHIDRDLMAKVQSATWFYPQDLGLIPIQTR